MQNKYDNLIDLAAEKIGGKVLYTTDDFFAEKENLIKEGRGVFIPDKYTERGKWMDGWESRRKRTSGHDWCILRLGAAGQIRGLDVDTNHFLGNHPPFAAVEAVHLEEEPTDWDKDENISWEALLPKSPLNPGSQHFFDINNDKIYTHLKLHIYPDGGVARLRAYGDVYKDWNKVDAKELLDVALVTNGGKALACNDMFFSKMDNLISPSKGKNMGDGWETKRNRTPDNVDWVILKLGHACMAQNIVVDTHHFKGNYPAACAIDACYSQTDEAVVDEKVEWSSLLEKQTLGPHQEHHFNTNQVNNGIKITHVKLKIYPDGGISRLRIMGKLVD